MRRDDDDDEDDGDDEGGGYGTIHRTFASRMITFLSCCSSVVCGGSEGVVFTHWAFVKIQVLVS